jgi:hypothetical protein
MLAADDARLCLLNCAGVHAHTRTHKVPNSDGGFFHKTYVLLNDFRLGNRGMLKKTFVGVIFAVFISSLLIVGINFNVTKAVEYSGSGTFVGGIIWENATWTLENSPYIITDTLQIPGNVTLIIEPGVIVTKTTGGTMFLLHGRIQAHGTINNKITFDGGGSSDFFDMYGSDSQTSLDLDYCTIRNGNRFWVSTRNEQWALFRLTHSELIDLLGYSNMYYFLTTGHTIYIEYNKFINSAGFLIGSDIENYVYVRYNLFMQNLGPCIRIKPVCSGRIIIEYNSFVDINGIALELYNVGGISVNASNNYWGTTDTNVIDSMIYDGKDSINIQGFIYYLPLLLQPHPDTPILLEDVKVDVNGVFRKDGDGKWRCYANITIVNNSYRNVTLRWIYLKAINITYIDETFEELDISGNQTLNFVIQPEHEFSLSWSITEYGFTKEPKILWVLLQTPILEAYGTITLTTVIPEFPSMLILLLFMIAALAATVYKRKNNNFN